MKHDPTEAKAFGQVLTRLRSAAGNPSYSSIERQMIGRIGELTPTDQSIANYHRGLTHPLSIHPEVLSELARIYGVRVSELGPVVEARCGRLRELVQNWKYLSPAA